ncbi:iron-sulfur cluster-binding domain-containing protein [Nocardioides sp. BGMRC 2183]|nr:iron-sulfur cluster-binding domain-containing protein [Nocardioides sp. BGMRC 2183]
MWAAHDVRARIVDIRRETAPAADSAPVATLTLQPTSNWRGHRAGQHVLVGVDVPGVAKRFTRAFSISSAASSPGEQITLTIRAHHEGQVSAYLVERAGVGEILHLSQARGDFTLNESPATPTNNHLLFITGGSGITPAMSMLRTLLRDGYVRGPRGGVLRGSEAEEQKSSVGCYDGNAGRKVTFLHYARSPEDQIFADELAAIAESDNGVTVHLRHGDRLFSEFELRRLVPDFADVDTWLCGPAGLVELVTAAYADSPRLRMEFFKPAVARAAGDDGDVEGTVTFARSDTAGPASAATLLEQAEALGLRPEFGCRMGICFSCAVTKTSGRTRNVLTGEESALPDEEIRICVTQPVGDCQIDL